MSTAIPVLHSDCNFFELTCSNALVRVQEAVAAASWTVYGALDGLTALDGRVTCFCLGHRQD